MGKKVKNKKIKRRKFKSLKKTNTPISKMDNSELEKEDEEKDKKKSRKKKISKNLLRKEKELKRKLKKMRRKNKKNKNEEDNMDSGNEYLDDLFMSQEDVDRLPHDRFFTYPIPVTPEENKDYIPLLISESDIILELLDARDIYHSRNTQIEELINSNENKLLIYILSKSDLVSNEYLEKIKKILQNEMKKDKNPIIDISSLLRETIQYLFEQIEQYAENLQKKLKEKKIIKIGIIGAPNVGKNSLVQSLELLVEADCTKKYIYFDGYQSFCINSVPGVIFDEKEENNFLISKKFKDIKEIEEPKKLIDNLMKFIDQNNLKNIYELKKIPGNLDDFIELIMEKYEFKEKNMSILKILEDIITGKITYEINIKQ